MAIKIDLLPGYVKLKRNLHRSITGCFLALVATGGLLFMVWKQRTLDLETAQENQRVAEQVVTQVSAATAEKEAANSDSAPLINAVSFMASASKTGPQRAALLNLVRQYIYEDAIVSSIDISDGQKVVIQATVRNPDEYARFLLNLRRASDTQGGTLFKGLPVASGPGGFANGAVPFVRPTGDGTGQAIVINYPVNVSAEGVLLNPVVLPPDPVGGSTSTNTTGGGSGEPDRSRGSSITSSPSPSATGSPR